MCAANHAMQLKDRMAEDTRMSKGIVELICANLVCTLTVTMFVIVLLRLYAHAHAPLVSNSWKWWRTTFYKVECVFQTNIINQNVSMPLVYAWIIGVVFLNN